MRASSSTRFAHSPLSVASRELRSCLDAFCAAAPNPTLVALVPFELRLHGHADAADRIGRLVEAWFSEEPIYAPQVCAGRAPRRLAHRSIALRLGSTAKTRQRRSGSRCGAILAPVAMLRYGSARRCAVRRRLNRRANSVRRGTRSSRRDAWQGRESARRCADCAPTSPRILLSRCAVSRHRP
jgi:hypothetical protein